MSNWFTIKNISDFDSPLLVVYPNRIKQNIHFAIDMAGNVSRLRPHVKTSKMSEVCVMLSEAGITKFKCATIAEAEMLALIEAPDVLLAYQPVGPKAQRFISLILTYPETSFSCLVDNIESATHLNKLAAVENIQVSVFIDLNVGMNRTGIQPEKAFDLAQQIRSFSSLQLKGLHAYDGHIHDSDIQQRKQKVESAFKAVTALHKQLTSDHKSSLVIIAGGTPTFPVHLQHKDVECSPGTFIFSDWGYKHSLPDQPFEYAALVITRVVSIIDKETVCVDLGHKSVAAENPLPRVHFLNAPDVVPASQSEEHLVLKVPRDSYYHVGDVLYGVPVHICPTVALYDKAYVVNDNNIVTSWKVIARNRTITV